MSTFIITDVWQHLIIDNHSVNRVLLLSPTLLGKKACVCVCILVCARYGVARILQVKEVFAISGKTCQRLVAMKDLQHSWRLLPRAKVHVGSTCGMKMR